MLSLLLSYFKTGVKLVHEHLVLEFMKHPVCFLSRWSIDTELVLIV